MDLASGFPEPANVFVEPRRPARVLEVGGIFHEGPPKSGRTRSIPLPPFLAEALAEQIIRYPSKGEEVFSSANGMPIRRQFVQPHFKPAVESAGLTPIALA